MTNVPGSGLPNNDDLAPVNARAGREGPPGEWEAHGWTLRTPRGGPLCCTELCPSPYRTGLEADDDGEGSDLTGTRDRPHPGRLSITPTVSRRLKASPTGSATGEALSAAQAEEEDAVLQPPIRASDVYIYSYVWTRLALAVDDGAED